MPKQSEMPEFLGDPRSDFREIFGLAAPGLASSLNMSVHQHVMLTRQAQWAAKGMSRKDTLEAGNARLKTNAQTASAMLATLEKSAVKNPEPSKDHVPVSGRVSAAGKGVEGLTVYAMDEKGAELASAQSDYAGTFDFVLTPETGFTLGVRSRKGTTLFQDDEVRSRKPGEVFLVEIALERATVADDDKEGEPEEDHDDDKYDPGKTTVLMPDIVGLGPQDAMEKLAKLGIAVDGAQLVPAASAVSGTVVETKPIAESSMEQGKGATLAIGADKQVQFRRPFVSAMMAANSQGKLTREEADAALAKMAQNGVSNLGRTRRLLGAGTEKFADASGLGDQAGPMRDYLLRLIAEITAARSG